MSRPPKENNLFAGGVITEEAMLAYLGNQLSAQDKAQFEKLLQDDPFAQDALEGLIATSNAAAVSSKISSIKKQVREKTGVKETRSIQLHWTAYAYAAVIFGVLIGVGFFMVNYLANQNHELALNKPQPTESVELINAKEGDSTINAEQPATIAYDSGAIQINFAHAQKEETPLKPAEETRGGELSVTDAGKKTLQKEELKLSQPAVGTTAASPVGNGSPPAAGATTYKVTESNLAKEDLAQPGTINSDKAPAKPDTKAKMSTDSYAAVVTVQEKELKKTDKPVANIDDAMKNFNSGNYQQSAEQFEQILKENPESAEALYFGGISDYILGNTKKSEKNFDKLLKTNRYNEGSKWYKANILLKNGKKAEAKKLLDEIAQGNSSYKERALNKLEELK